MWYTINARYGEALVLADIDRALAGYIMTGSEDKLFVPLDQQKAKDISLFKRMLINSYIRECESYFFKVKRNQEDTVLPETLVQFANMTASEQRPFGINEKIKQKMNVVVLQDDSEDQS